MRTFALLLVLVLVAGFAWLFLDIRVNDAGKLPEIDVTVQDSGRLPDVDVGVRDVELTTEERTVEVPRVTVGD